MNRTVTLSLVAILFVQGPGAGLAQQLAAAPPPAQRLEPDREARLRARVAAWHEARKIRDSRAMYDLLDPAYRAKTDFGAFTGATTARLKYPLVSYEILGVAATANDAASVEVRLMMNLGRFGDSPVVALDRWVWREDDWWLVFKPFEPPFPKP